LIVADGAADEANAKPASATGVPDHIRE